MKTAIIYHSHSGITRGVAEKIHESLASEMIEVTPKKAYSPLMLVPKGCYRAMKRIKDPVHPKTIDVSGYDNIVVASPVWAGKPTPVINGAIDALSGCQGKKAFVILTCRNAKSGIEALVPFIENLKAKGLEISKTAVLDQEGAVDSASITKVITDIRSAGGEV